MKMKQQRADDSSDFEFLVIGKGLLGSAAARYLSLWSDGVGLLGPDEPAELATHDGVFASHYDQGRLIRLISRSAIYTELVRQAMASYEWLQAASGVQFYNPVGALVAGEALALQADGFRELAAAAGTEHRWYEPGDDGWRARFPALDFPPGYSIMTEAAPAGYLNPRELVRAQVALAARQGTTVIRETAVSLTQTSRTIMVQTAVGHRYTARKVLVAAGAFTNFNNLLPQPLALRPKTEAVILAEVSAAAAARLANYPVVKYLVDDPEIFDIYMVPPLRYPNGRFYIKLGCNSTADQFPQTLDELQAWFRSGDSDACKPAMARAVRSLWPTTQFLSMETKRCAICRTPTGYPLIDRLNGRLVVAAGGNGIGAGSSDALGQLAAGLIYDGRWPNTIPRDPFRAIV